MNAIERRTRERGSAMVVSLLALLVLTMVGTMFMMQTKTETQIAGHDMRHTQALYNAEAGTAETLARMSNMNDEDNYIGESPAGPFLPGWGRYVVLETGNSAKDPNYHATEEDGLDNDGDVQIDEEGEHFPEVATAQTQDAIGYPWVRVRYKLNTAQQPILFGDHDNDVTTPAQPNLVRGLPIIIVTASGTQGSAGRTVEVEAVKHPFVTPNAAIYMESDDAQFNGTQFLVSGQDWDPVTGLPIVGPEVPGIVTTGDPAAIAGELDGQQINNVEGAGADPSVVSSPIDLDLAAMVAEYSSMAEHTLPGGTYSNTSWGSVDDYTVVHCTGDMHTSGENVGGGLLIVEGDFDCSGQFLWHGMVIVLGNITFTGGGSGIHIYGTVLSGGNDLQVIGGQADLLYSSAAIAQLSAELTRYTVASWQEL